MIKVNCDYCGREYETYPSSLKNKQNHFCSRECANKFLKGKKTCKRKININFTCLNGELWKDIKGYEGKYQVSSFGRVKNALNYIMSVIPDKDGYSQVSLRKPQGKACLKRLHRLVALAFIPNLQNKKYINHIDGNKENNHIENLEWCTNGENIHHAYKIGLRSNEKFWKPVICVTTGKRYSSITEASKDTNIEDWKISFICKGKEKFKSRKGLVFEYI